MKKKTALQITISGVLTCAFVIMIIALSNTNRHASSNETAEVSQTITIEQTTKTEKVVKNTEKKKVKKSLFPKKYQKINVVKVIEEDETTASDIDYLDEIAEVYKEKSLSSEEAGVALEGCIVKVQSRDKKWTKIKSGEVEGYIESRYIVKGKKARQVLFDTEHVLAKMKKNNADIRKDKNKKSASIGIAYAKNTYPILEISKDEKWVKIKRTESLSGWIPSSAMELKIDKEHVYTSEAYDEMVEAEWKVGAVSYKLETSALPENSEARQLIKFASKFLGNRYVWGGTSLTKGADCSGFVQSVFKHFGYKLNRTAAEQYKNGQAVSNNKIKPGDLLFYHTDRRQKNRISHVAIYIGNGKILHAANRRAGIVISNMGNPCAARRILNGKANDKKDEKHKKEKSKNNVAKIKGEKVEIEKKTEVVTEKNTEEITTQREETSKSQDETNEIVQEKVTENETVEEME